MRGEGLKDGNKEVDNVLVSAVFALEKKVLVMEDYLTIHILHHDPESLRGEERKKKGHSFPTAEEMYMGHTSDVPWILSSHWKSGVMTSSTCKVDLNI